MDVSNSTSLAAQALSDAFRTAYTTQFLRDQIHALNSRDTCWHPSGVHGLLTLLYANVSQDALDVNISQGIFNLSSSGNYYSIDLGERAFEVNGLTESTYITLTCVHSKCRKSPYNVIPVFDANQLPVFTMAIAFFLVYPIILLLGSVNVLCDLINRPIEKQKFKRWETRLQSLCFTPLVIAGLATGLLAMGSSDHFRTEHGVGFP